MNKTRAGIVIAIVLFVAYLIWNYRDEYVKTYVYQEVSSADSASYVPSEQQPKAEGVTLYKLAVKTGDARPYRYVLWSKQSPKEFGYQKAQLKKASDAMTINIRPITAENDSQVKADLIVYIESEKDLSPILIYNTNKRAAVTEVSLP